MKKCLNCNINFNIKNNYCPLCQNKLIGNNYDLIFPNVTRFKTHKLLLKLLLFISIICLIISMFIESFFDTRYIISLFIMGGLITNYIVIYYIIKYKENIFGLLNRYGFILVLLALIWYLVTKSVIITNYIIPSVCLFELIFNVVIFVILKNNYLVNYFSLILVNIMLVIVPIVLVLLGCTTFDLLSYICLIVALIIIVGLIIFYFDEIIEQFKRIFNL